VKTSVQHTFSPGSRFETLAEFRRQIVEVPREQLLKKYAPRDSAGDKLDIHTKIGAVDGAHMIEFAFVGGYNKLSAVMRAELFEQPLGGTEIVYSMATSRFNLLLVFVLSMYVLFLLEIMYLSCREAIPRLGYEALYWAVVTGLTAVMFIWFEIVEAIATKRKLTSVVQKVVATLQATRRVEQPQEKSRRRRRALKKRSKQTAV
jgi:hypothetical protein